MSNSIVHDHLCDTQLPTFEPLSFFAYRTEAVLAQCSESFGCISRDPCHYCYFVDSVSISIPKLLLHGTTSSFAVKSGLKPVSPCAIRMFAVDRDG